MFPSARHHLCPVRSKHLHLFYTANNSTSHTHKQPNQPADLIQTVCFLQSFSNIPVSLSLSLSLRNSPSNKLQMSSVSMDTGEMVCVTQDITHPRKQLHFCNQMVCVCDIILLDIRISEWIRFKCGKLIIS